MTSERLLRDLGKLTRTDIRPLDVAKALPTTQPAPVIDALLMLPDPIEARASYDVRSTRVPATLQKDAESLRKIFFPLIEQTRRLRQYDLSLRECLRRTLANNYQIRIEGHGPAISEAQIVQAEAAFDAAVFGTVNRNDMDQATPEGRRGNGVFGQSENNQYSAGVRQRTPTGAQVSITEVLNRAYPVQIPGQERMPTYTSNLVIEVRQPVLRNFGLDFNRSQIDINKNARAIAMERFRRQVITTLNDAERAYWTLVGARRNATISAELLAFAKLTLEQVEARRIYDAFATLAANSRAQVFSREAQYITDRNAIGDAEDQLRNIMNDPELNLSRDIEIIPTEDPLVTGVLRDRPTEVEVALTHRPEIKEAELTVENARIQIGIAKNQALPTLDVVYRATLNGLGGNADRAFDRMTSGNFVDNYIALEFAWNFAERGERAAIRIAALQHSSAVTAFRLAVDNVITDCKVALRRLETGLSQIIPSSEAVKAAQENLRSLQERQERKSPEQLNSIFSAQSQLAGTKQQLLQAIITYNQSLIEVERAKGTLLEYDNISLVERP